MEKPDNEPWGSPKLSGDDEGQSLPSRGRRYWLLPIVIATISVTLLLLLNPRWGADVAAIIVIPVNVAAVLIPILANYRVGSAPPRGPRMTRKLRIATIFTTATLVFSGGVYWFTREPDPLEYLSGTVYIGINEESYPGWNEVSGNEHAGFDIALAKWLGQKYNFKAELIPLSREGRMDRLEDADDDLELVIANFSINQDRERYIDFAGPYFTDTQGLYTYEEGKTLTEIEPGRLCVPLGTTAADKLTRAGWKPVSEPSFERCFQRLTYDNNIDAVSTDSAVMNAYISERGTGIPNLNVIEDINIEEYGIGMPNNRPRLCAELSKAIAEFIKEEWDDAFAEHLENKGVSVEDKKPDPESLNECNSTALF